MMARNEQDPAANTQQFRAFAKQGESAGQGSSTSTTAIVAAVAAAVVALVVVALLIL